MTYYSKIYEKNKIKLNIINNGTLDENSPRYSEKISGLKNIDLKQHQLAFLYAAKLLESNVNNNYKTNIAILGDTVGSGKSISMLSLIMTNKKLDSIKLPCETIIKNNNGFIVYENDNTLVSLNIILVPHTIVNQWENYIKSYTDLSYLKINSKKTSVFSKIDLDNKDIFLISANFFKDFQTQLDLIIPDKKILFSRFIIDEADNIKFGSKEHINSNMIWFITSSIENLFFTNGKCLIPKNWDNYSSYNNYIYFKGLGRKNFISELFSYIENGTIHTANMLNKICLKNNTDFIKLSFNLDTPNVYKYICKTPIGVNILLNLNINFKNEILDLINANDITSISEKLGCDINDSDTLVKNLCSKFNKNLDTEYKYYEYLNSLDIDENSKNEKLKTCQKKIDEIKII